MKIEEQVITLEQAKRLKELGVNAPSMFEHIYTPIHTREGKLDFTTRVVLAGTLSDSDKSKYYPAYTVAELGEIINKLGIKQMPFYEYYPHTDKDMWKFINPYTKYNEEKIVTDCNNEAQARAEMLIHLITKEPQ